MQIMIDVMSIQNRTCTVKIVLKTVNLYNVKHTFGKISFNSSADGMIQETLIKMGNITSLTLNNHNLCKTVYM